jgi:hypothetical protein
VPHAFVNRQYSSTQQKVDHKTKTANGVVQLILGLKTSLSARSPTEESCVLDEMSGMEILLEAKRYRCPSA